MTSSLLSLDVCVVVSEKERKRFSFSVVAARLSRLLCQVMQYVVVVWLVGQERRLPYKLVDVVLPPLLSFPPPHPTKLDSCPYDSPTPPTPPITHPVSPTGLPLILH